MKTISMMTDADCLSLLTRRLFASGFSLRTVEARWPAFEAAFHGFDPERVAAMTAQDLARILKEGGVVRNLAKLRATVANARLFRAAAAEHGSFCAWLRAVRGRSYEEQQDTLLACLHHVGPSTLFWFLHEVGEATLDDKPEGVV